MNTPHSNGKMLSPWALKRVFEHLNQIGSQVNVLVVKFGWEKSMMPHVRQISSELQLIRQVLRSA